MDSCSYTRSQSPRMMRGTMSINGLSAPVLVHFGSAGNSRLSLDVNRLLALLISREPSGDVLFSRA